MGVIPGRSTDLAVVVSQNGTDELTSARVPEHVRAVRVGRLSVVLAEFALAPGLEGAADARVEAG